MRSRRPASETPSSDGPHISMFHCCPQHEGEPPHVL
jgi:hypothetical protein